MWWWVRAESLVYGRLKYRLCVLYIASANPGMRGNASGMHLPSQLPWMAALLLVAHICAVYLLDELVLGVYSGLCMVQF